jgi:hypothetical protein
LSNSFKIPEQRPSPGLARRAEELRSELRLIPAALLAARTGTFNTTSGTGSGEFHFQYYGSDITGSFPDFKFFSSKGDELPEFHQLMLLYYFSTCDGSVPSGSFVSFSDLPGGRLYAQAFQGYTGNEVVKAFGENISAFKDACELENGIRFELGDAAFLFQVLPKLAVQLVYWLGDDDFPSSCKILFEAASTHYVPIDCCAAIGSNLAHRVIKKYQTMKNAF